MRLPKTISLQVGRKLANKTKDEILTEVLRVFAGLDVKAVQIAYEVFRVTFASPEHLFGLWCSILGGGPPVTCVHVFDFPFEEDDRSLEVAFEAYGAVKSVKKQTFLSNQNIFNGTRLVDVVLSGVLPRFLMVDGYLCRLWYRGQPLVCNLCAVQGHRSANCPNKDKCRKCGQSGHFARNCTSDGSAGDLADFPPLASSPQSAEANVSLDSSDSQLLKDNELDLMQSQSILQDLVPVSGESSGESNQRASKRAGKDKGSSAKRSNSTSNICFTNSQEFASLLANSELENNENTAVCNEQLNFSNENISVNSTERSNEVINNSSANSTERVNEVINNNTEISNEVINNSSERVNEVIYYNSTERSNEVINNSSAKSTERVNEVINNNTEISNEVINNSTERVNEVIYYNSTERSNEVNDITVNESNVAIVENVAVISSIWASWREKKSDFVTVMDWWEVAKSKIKGLTVTYCKNRAERLRNRRNLLVWLVSHLKGRVDGGHSDCVGPYQAALAELKQLDLVDAEGAHVRARVRWVEEGECSSAYFCKLEKKHRSESCITALRGSDNVVYTGAEGIQSVLSSFYADLFSKEETDLTVQASLLSNV